MRGNQRSLRGWLSGQRPSWKRGVSRERKARIERGEVIFFSVLALLPGALALMLGEVKWWVQVIFFPSVVLLTTYFWSFLRARRRRADFLSGQSERVVRAAEEEVGLGEVPSNYRALALVGVGDFAAARRALLASGLSADAECRELGLCARIWIEAFEGEPSVALALCRELLQRPGLVDLRSVARRESALAVTRIVAGVGDEDDDADLCRAAIYEPALLWACRYAMLRWGRVLRSSKGRWELLRGAPPWPRESHFFGLQKRLVERMRFSPASIHRA